MNGDNAPIVLSDQVARTVRTRLGLYGHPTDLLVPLTDMVAALGDAIPLASLSRVLDADRPDAMVTLRTDGILDTTGAPVVHMGA